MKCRDFQEMIDSYLSDELLTETNHDVLRHMENCANCRGVVEARREVRSRLKSAVTNAPQYTIDKNFTHNLRTQLRHEALQNQEVSSSSWFSFGSWAAVAAGLVLVATFGFIIFNNVGTVDNPGDIAAKPYQPYQTEAVPHNHIVNVAFGDHQYCAIKFDPENPVKLVDTPAQYAKFEEVAMPELKTVLADYKIKKSHTCEYNGTKFTHLVVTKDDKTVSLMLTERDKANQLSEQISTFSSDRYQLARFDVNDTAVFVVSGLEKEINSQVAKTLYSPLRKHLNSKENVQVSLNYNMQASFLAGY